MEVDNKGEFGGLGIEISMVDGELTPADLLTLTPDSGAPAIQKMASLLLKAVPELAKNDLVSGLASTAPAPGTADTPAQYAAELLPYSIGCSRRLLGLLPGA